MQPELLIAIVSSLITLLASFFLATYRARVEFRKMAKQLEEKYTTSLFNKRFEIYPLLFKLLNELNNAIDCNSQSKQMLNELLKQFDGWMSANAIFLTRTLAQIAWGYHNFLMDLLEQYIEELTYRRIETELNLCNDDRR